MPSKFENALAERDGKSKFVAAIEERDEGFNPFEAVGDFVSGAVDATVQAVRGKQDPAFKDVPGFSTEGFRDPEFMSRIERAKVLGVSDEAFGGMVKEALGPRLLKEEKDKFGQEVITFVDDDGKKRREFINKPGLTGADIERGVQSSIPFLAAGGVVGKAVQGANLGVRAVAQAVGQVSASLGQDIAGDQPIDPGKAAAAGGGGLLGEALLPLIRLFRSTPGLVDKAGKLTDRGEEVIRNAGIDPDDVTPDFIQQLASPDLARSADDVQAAVRAQADEFGIPSSAGQRTLDPEALAFEEQARRGLLGRGAKEVATDFDANQRAAVARSVDEQTEALGGVGAQTPGEVGERLQTGLAKADDAATQRITEAFQDIDIPGIFPKGIPKTAFDDLGARLNTELGTLQQTLSPSRTPAAIEALEFLDNFSKGKVKQPQVGLLKKGAAPKSNFDTVRRDLNTFVSDAKTPTDLAAATAVKRAYGQWIDNLANEALKSANPEQFARLQSAITLTAKTKELFTVRSPQDFGGKIIQKILDTADSPEGAISTLVPASFKGAPKPGSVNAATRLKKILQKEQPDAWHAMRQAYWLKMSRSPNLFKDGPITRGELDTALGQVSRNIDDAFKNQKSMIDVLFTKQEQTKMRAFGRATRRSQAVNPNPSGTSFEAQRMRSAANDNVLPVLLRRQAAGQQIRGNAVRATFFRILTKRAVSLLGARGEGIAAREAGEAFSGQLPRPRTTGGGGLGSAAGVQTENQL